MIKTTLTRNGKEYTTIAHVGTTLSTYEVNGYHDSDWYAVVYNEQTGKLDHVEFATTRFPCNAECKVDATPEIAQKALKVMTEQILKGLIARKEKELSAVNVGSQVLISKGRTAKGKTGEIFWIGGEQRYGYNTVRKVGVKFSDAKDADGKYSDCAFTYLHNVELSEKPELPIDYLTKVAEQEARDNLCKVL